VASFVRNVQYLSIDNRKQLELISRAEALTGPEDVYFDGIGMLPNRSEPSTLWLDRRAVVTTLSDKESSEAFRIFAEAPPKIILWSYRMHDVRSVLMPLIETRYAKVAPNLRLAGRALRTGQPTDFDVTFAGRYALYDRTGRRLPGGIEVDGRLQTPPFDLGVGRRSVVLRAGASEALLLPERDYVGLLSLGRDDPGLFDKVYD
jgi:hypothetical protein